ncbi:MAG: L,D-transpeptidase [Myxococcota bacterium]
MACEDAAPVDPPEVAAEPAAVEPEVEVEPERPEPEPEPEGPPKRIFAKRFVVPVRDAPSRQANRVGYLRAGSVLQATTYAPIDDRSAQPDENGNPPTGRAARRCPRGWYELSTGGFVCNVRDVIAFEGRRLPEHRSTQPDRERPLPYEYGFLRRQAPMYRRPPTDEDAAQHEGYRIPGQEPPEEATVAEGSEGGTDLETAPTMATAVTPTEMASPMTPSEMAAAIGEAGTPEVPEEEEPITLDRLAGERDSVVMRTMMRGFYVSLDRPIRRGARRYWRTQSNGYVPYNAVLQRSGSEYHGIELAEGVSLPFAFVLNQSARAYTRNEETGRFRAARGRREYRDGFPVLEEAEDRGREYVRADEELWYRVSDLRIARPEPMRPEMGPNDKWFDINLATQILTAYEGERPVYITLISSGLPDRTNMPDRDYETLAGLHRVKSKHLTDTMDGDTAFDGPYSVDDVPYVMYYELAYALHSAFWHNRFGRPKSHGCVNLSPLDAKWVFNWADPPLPEGWHSAYPSEETPGTWIWVHDDTWGRR